MNPGRTWTNLLGILPINIFRDPKPDWGENYFKINLATSYNVIIFISHKTTKKMGTLNLPKRHVLVLENELISKNTTIISVQDKSLVIDLPYRDILITLSKEDAIRLRKHLNNIQLEDCLD